MIQYQHVLLCWTTAEKKLTKAIRAFGQRRELYETICSDLGVKHLELIIDFVTRWNSTYEMMERALLMKQVTIIFRKFHGMVLLFLFLKCYRTLLAYK